MEKENKFWKKALKCKHRNVYPNYGVSACSTPYCYGYEYHCKDCKVYFSTCRCGDNVGMSGWSSIRWKNFNYKKARRCLGKTVLSVV